MASGDPMMILEAQGANQPSTLYATHDTILGASTPAEVVPVLDFDAAATEYCDWRVRLSPKYAGGGLTCSIRHSASSATSGTARIGIAIRAIPDDAEDLDTTAHTYDYNEATLSPAGTVGEVAYDNITFTDGADMDSLAAGQECIVRVYRDHDHANDDMSGDWELHAILVTET